MRSTPTCIALVTLCAISTASFAAAPGKALLEKAQKEDRALRADDKRLRLRHHGEKLIAAWEAAEKACNGADRVAALKGQAAAWRLLAHWSGRSDDLAKANAIEAKLEDGDSKKKRPVIAQAQKETKKVATSERPAQAGPVWLSKVTVEAGEDGLNLQLSANGEFSGQRESLPKKAGQKARVYFDLSPMIAAMEVLGAIKVDHPALAKVRVGQFDADTVRVVIDYRGDEAPVMPSLEGRTIAMGLGGSAPNLAKVDGAPENKAAAPVEKPAEEVGAIATASATQVLEGIVAEMKNAYPELMEAEVEIESVADAALDTAGLKRSTKEALGPRSGSILQIRRVMIDAGHGGKDQGAVGVGGVEEKDVNLAIAKKLGEQLERKGLKVSYTRTTDKFLSLRDRSVIANKSGADLFISVHANAHTKKKIHGIETYYLNVTGDRYASRLARRENALEEEEGESPEPGVGAAEDAGELPTGSLGQDLRLILADLAMRSATSESRRLAGFVQGSLVGNLRRQHDDVKDLGVKHALFYVLLGTRMPSVLIETGFVTHATEGRRLASDKYQDEVARSIAQGVLRFVEERERLASRDDGGIGVIARAAP
ncbi:MAG: N-acetylmuramoyl-L-alanine amidase [Deltaproteobacteria bacterium]|nr:N-acetylmuramoyl-L-alanine amidase [Deltaproteobacteria bacterium]